MYDADTVSPIRVEIWKENNFFIFLQCVLVICVTYGLTDYGLGKGSTVPNWSNFVKIDPTFFIPRHYRECVLCVDQFCVCVLCVCVCVVCMCVVPGCVCYVCVLFVFVSYLCYLLRTYGLRTGKGVNGPKLIQLC